MAPTEMLAGEATVGSGARCLLRPDLIAEYDAARSPGRKGFRSACYAPFVSMYFDVHGHVTACCQNTKYPLGSIPEQSLRSIWDGRPTAALRDALTKYRFGPECEFCRWQIEDGNWDTFATKFDGFPADDREPLWPAQMEFALSNTCNLECIMCHGEFSSKIRARREHRPPLPAAYADTFFDELREFLPHLVRTRFFGGEPFLARESFRVWELMIEDGLAVDCNVTTNGTIWNPRVAHVLEHLPFTIGVSIDGVRPETVEHIRSGASHAEIMANLDRFQAYTRERGTGLSLTFCLMQPNWREFADYLRFADERGCPVFVNTVVYPPSLSLHRLGVEDLNEVIHSLEGQDRSMCDLSPHNRQVWEHELHRLRSWHQRLERRANGEGDDTEYFEVHVEGGPNETTVSPPDRRVNPGQGSATRRDDA